MVESPAKLPDDGRLEKFNGIYQSLKSPDGKSLRYSISHMNGCFDVISHFSPTSFCIKYHKSSINLYLNKTGLEKKTDYF